MGAATFLTISSNFMPSSSRSSLQCRTSTMFDGASDDNAADGQQTINEQATTDSTCKKTTCPPGIIDDSIQENAQTVRHEQGPRKLEKLARQCRSFIYKQATATDNRYALQVSIAFLVAAMAVIIQPVSNLAPNAFWVGVSVVTVMDNTIGGFLTLSIQRMMGTIIGGGLSIIVMTVTRAIFPVWSWKAIVLLCTLMFCQVFIIAKFKLRPNMNYAGGIGLLTTVIILLSGYPDLIRDHLSGSAKLALWRVTDLVIGIVIAMWVSLSIFPLKARHTMRKNLAASLEEAANLYERTLTYCFGFQRTTSSDHANSTSAHLACSESESKGERTAYFQSLEESIPHDMEIWNNELLNDLCNSAFRVLAKLQTESSRLQSVSKEYHLQIPVDLVLCRGKERIKQDMLRSKRYKKAVEAMKRIVWPLVSFRLLLPLIKLQNAEATGRRTPPLRTIENFQDSLSVMRQLATILQDTTRTLNEDSEWALIQHRVVLGVHYAQHELAQTIVAAAKPNNLVDRLTLLTYYGFLVRCCTAWQGLESIVNELGPQQSRKPISENISTTDVPINFDAVGNRPAGD